MVLYGGRGMVTSSVGDSQELMAYLIILEGWEVEGIRSRARILS